MVLVLTAQPFFAVKLMTLFLIVGQLWEGRSFLCGKSEESLQ
jgi:hypothetical protein